MHILQPYCAYPENISTPPRKGFGFSGGGGPHKTKQCKEMYEA